MRIRRLPSAAGKREAISPPGIRVVRISSLPLPAMASRELMHKLSRAWCSWLGSIHAGGRSSGQEYVISMVRGKVTRSILTRSAISSWILSERNSASDLRAKVKICLTMALPRSAASLMVPRAALAGEFPFSLPARTAAWPLMIERILLKSWAMPPASVPRLSSFWFWRISLSRMRCSSSPRRRSEISRKVVTCALRPW